MLFFAFGGGVTIGDFNHVGFLPVVKRILDPSYLPGDFGIELRLDHHRVFAWAVAIGTHFIGQNSTLIALTLFARVLQALALWSLARTLRLSPLAFVGVGLAVAGGAFFAGKGAETNSLLGSPAIMPPPFALALGLWAVAALIRRQIALSTLCAGAAMLLHLQIGSIFTLLLFPFWYVEVKRLSVGAKVVAALAWAAPALPALFILSHMAGHSLLHSGAQTMSLVQYINFRQPHHFIFRLGRVSGVALHLGVLWWLVKNLKATPDVEVEPDADAAYALKTMLGLSLFLAGLCVVHYVDFHLIHNGKFALLQTIRLTPLITTFTTLAVAWWLQERFRAAQNDPVQKRQANSMLTLAGSGVLVWTAVAVLLPRSNFSLGVERYSASRGAWFDVCHWVKNYGLSDGRYLTPPGQTGFVYLTDHSNVVEFKINPDGGIGLEEWLGRLRDLSGGDLPERRKGQSPDAAIDAAYAKLNGPQLIAVGRKYGARYAVIRASSLACLPVLYRNKQYRVVALSPPRPRLVRGPSVPVS